MSRDQPGVSSRRSIPASAADHPNGHLRRVVLGCLHDEVLDCGLLQDSVQLMRSVQVPAQDIFVIRVPLSKPSMDHRQRNPQSADRQGNTECVFITSAFCFGFDDAGQDETNRSSLE